MGCFCDGHQWFVLNDVSGGPPVWTQCPKCNRRSGKLARDAEPDKVKEEIATTNEIDGAAQAKVRAA